MTSEKLSAPDGSHRADRIRGPDDRCVRVPVRHSVFPLSLWLTRKRATFPELLSPTRLSTGILRSCPRLSTSEVPNVEASRRLTSLNGERSTLCTTSLCSTKRQLAHRRRVSLRSCDKELCPRTTRRPPLDDTPLDDSIHKKVPQWDHLLRCIQRANLR